MFRGEKVKKNLCKQYIGFSVLVANVTLANGKCIVSNTDFLFSLRNLINQCSLVYQVISLKG